MLPTLEELQEIYHQRKNIESAAIQHGGSGFYADTYLSSTMYNTDAAWGVNFISGDAVIINASNAVKVRCIVESS